MNSKAFHLLILTIIGLFVASCDENPTIGKSTENASVTISLPSTLQVESIADEKISFKNISTGQTTVFASRSNIMLLDGLYDVSYEATAKTASNAEVKLSGHVASVQISPSQTTISIPAFVVNTGNDFIISEIFFTGTLQTSGNNYTGDNYIKIYNNTDSVLYADGLTLVESKFNTTQKYDYTPNIMNEAVTVHALYTIPGSGKEHPIKPGEFILLSDIAIDHRASNPNSFDLSHSNWEWYDVSTVPAHQDIDNPDVPNLDKWYCYTQSVWLLHNRGFKGYGIARIPIDKETYLKDYYYKFDYVMVLESGTYQMSGNAYKLPNEWIVDWVNCCVQSEFQWIVSAPSLDQGWTHCGSIDGDKTRFFHSVRRKMLYLKDDSIPYFQDTNNSTNDFNPDCIASEIELQHSVYNQSGDKATTITYDGVQVKNK